MPDVQLLLEFEAVEKQIALLTPDEIFANASMELLSKLREDPRLEWKPAGYHRDPLATYFSMWANTAPEGGIIAIGVANDGSFAGCSGITQEQLNGHEKAGRELCPDARYDTKRIACLRTSDQQLDFLLLIRVYYRDDKVVETNKGEAHIRRGDSCDRLSEE
jgi:ATP-dependent DNA helicase RecG